MHTRSLLLALAVLALTAAAPALADSPDARQRAQALASQAVRCLERGEDLTETDAKRKEYERGLELARQALALDDDNADAHFAVFGNEGRLMLLDGVTPNPISLLKVNRELDRALDLNPNHSDALAAKGGLYRQLPWALGGSLSRAEECLTKAIAADPEAVGARIELAATYRDMGEPQRSLPLLQDAVSIAERKGKQRQLTAARTLLVQLEAPR